MAKYLTAVDLGSNSFCTRTINLENPDWSDTLFNKRTVGLANFIDKNGVIAKEGISKAQKTIDAILQSANEETKFVAVGTETLRSAKNSSEFINFAEQALNCPIQIISGNREAQIMFTGATYLLPKSTSKRLVIDIGGASVEFAFGSTTPESVVSIKLGCLQMYNDFFANRSLSKTQWNVAVESIIPLLESELSSIKNLINESTEVYGISGTFLGIHKLANIILGQTHSVSTSCLDKLLVGKTISMLIPQKVKVLYGGTALLNAIAKVLNIKEIQPAYGDLSLGLLIEEYQNTCISQN